MMTPARTRSAALRRAWSAPVTALVVALMSVSLVLTADAQTSRPKVPTTRPAKPITAPAIDVAKPGTGTAKPAAKRESDPKAIAIVDRYLEKVGGKDAFRKINDRQEQFINSKFSATDVAELKMSRALKRNKELEAVMLREEWELVGIQISDKPLRFVQVYNGEEGFVKAMGYVSPLKDRTLTVFLWDKPIDDFFMAWQQDGYTVTYVKEDTFDDVPVDVIETTSFAGNSRMAYSFSKKDGFLLRKVWSEVGPKGPVRKEVTYEEYSKVRFRDDPNVWIMYPLQQKIWEDGELSLMKEYQSITINGGVSSQLFARPDGPDLAERKKNPAGSPKADPTKKADTAKPTSQPKSTSDKATSRPKG